MRPRLPSIGTEEGLYSYVEHHSTPPRAMIDAQHRLEARLLATYPEDSDRDEISAIHDLHDLQKKQRAADVAAVASRFELEHAARVAAESSLARIHERGWAVIVGVSIACLAALIIGGTIAILRASHLPPTTSAAPPASASTATETLPP